MLRTEGQQFGVGLYYRVVRDYIRRESDRGRDQPRPCPFDIPREDNSECCRYEPTRECDPCLNHLPAPPSNRTPSRWGGRRDRSVAELSQASCPRPGYQALDRTVDRIRHAVGRDGADCTLGRSLCTLQCSRRAASRAGGGRRGEGAAQRRRHPRRHHGPNPSRARPQCCRSKRAKTDGPLRLPGTAGPRRLRPRRPRRGRDDRGTRAQALRGGGHPRARGGTRKRSPMTPRRIPNGRPRPAQSSWAASRSRTTAAPHPSGPACRPRVSCCRSSHSRGRKARRG